MQFGEDSRRLGNQHQGGCGLDRSGPRPADPTHFEAHSPPFELAAIQAIYIPEARRRASTHSPSAAEEQRREGHHLEEEKVELVD
jgi:hypothetical protein